MSDVSPDLVSHPSDIQGGELASRPSVSNPLTKPIASNTVRYGSAVNVKQINSVAGKTQFYDTSSAFFQIQGRPQTTPYESAAFDMSTRKPMFKKIEAEVPDSHDFASWLKAQMTGRHITGGALEEFTGVDRSTFSRLLKGDRAPGIDVVAKIVTFFDRGDDPVFDQKLQNMIVPPTRSEDNSELRKNIIPEDTGVLSGTPSEQLDRYIVASRLSNRQFGKIAGVNHSTTSRLRRANDRLPDLDIFSKLAVALDLDAQQIKGYLKAVVDGSLSEEDASRLTQAQPKVPAPKVPDKPAFTEAKPQLDEQPVWARYESITPEVFGDIVSIWENIFGVLPKGGADYLKLKQVLTEVGIATWSLKPNDARGGLSLEAIRLANEKGTFVRFKAHIPGTTVSQDQQMSNPKIDAFQRGVRGYLKRSHLAIENKDAVGQFMTYVIPEEIEENVAIAA